MGKIKRKFGPNDPGNVYSKLETVIIYEIFMVRDDLLDLVDNFLRLNTSQKNQAFGGIQMIFINYS